MAEGNGRTAIPDNVAQNPAVMALRITALEDGLEKITQMFTQNMNYVKTGFNHTDAHLWVLKQLCVDMAMKDDIPMVEDSDPENPDEKMMVPDLTPYYTRYNAMMKAQAEAAEEAAKQPSEPPPDEPAEEEFGGDVDDQSSQQPSAEAP